VLELVTLVRDSAAAIAASLTAQANTRSRFRRVAAGS
jgi:hypothetical protein